MVFLSSMVFQSWCLWCGVPVLVSIVMCSCHGVPVVVFLLWCCWCGVPVINGIPIMVSMVWCSCPGVYRKVFLSWCSCCSVPIVVFLLSGMFLSCSPQGGSFFSKLGAKPNYGDIVFSHSN